MQLELQEFTVSDFDIFCIWIIFTASLHIKIMIRLDREKWKINKEIKGKLLFSKNIKKKLKNITFFLSLCFYYSETN